MRCRKGAVIDGRAGASPIPAGLLWSPLPINARFGPWLQAP
jgi:hypothetical protein